MQKTGFNLLLTIILLSLSFSCKNAKNKTITNRVNFNKTKPLQTISFGSCNKQFKSQEMWDFIVMQQPDLWIWMGDNIYGDSENMQIISDKYAQVLATPGYQKLMHTCPIIGIWDDHDFGVNDGGKSFPKKDETKKLMLDFLGVAKDASVRKRAGAYQTYQIGTKGKTVKVILLDARYFRDDLEPNPTKETRYLQNTTGDILGEAQWTWLEKELSNNDAQLTLIVNGMQVIPTEHRYEKWDNFPTARKRFFDLLAKTKTKNTILLSGDRHIAEISKITWPKMSYPIYEITSSGLTHTWGSIREEANQFRDGALIIKRNFGVIKIDWDKKPLEVLVEIRGLANALYLEKTIRLQD